MSRDFQIRTSTANDSEPIERLYTLAFAGEDLVPLVRDLLSQPSGIMSLAALLDQAVAGHVCFSLCGVEGCRSEAALLGPLAVAPAFQKRGLGGALMRDGFDRLTRDGVARVCVLGDPAYYGRFGFVAETQISPPYPLAAEWRTAWQSLRLGGAEPSCGGRLSVPGPWRRPNLWAP